MDRFSRINNQAPAQTQLEKDSSPVGRSAHDFSYIHSGNALFGAVIPVDCFDVVPNEDISLSVAALLEFRNPSVRQLLNSCRVYFHAYYNRLSDLWEGAKNWIDKGRSGKLDLTRPNLIYHTKNYNEDAEVNACTPMSLLNFLGLPAEYLQVKNSSSVLSVDFPPLRSFQACISSTSISGTVKKLGDSVDYFPADCCLAYQRNWRDYYSNKNLLQNNKFWFPDNEEHFIISYECENACCINYGDEELKNITLSGAPVAQKDALYYNLASGIGATSQGYMSTPEANNPETVAQPAPSSAGDLKYMPNLSALKFRQFRGDRFTASLPFPDLIRGDIPILSLNESAIRNIFVGRADNINVKVPNTTYNTGDTTFTTILKNNAPGARDVPGDTDGDLLSYYTPSTSVTMSDIYTLETLTAFKRRMAMNNGDYNSMIESQFGVSPKVHDRHGTYIGGFYQDFAFSAVLQTSESNSTPLGTKAGQGVSSGSGNIGSFHTPDFGWIQIYMMIVPDVMYTQGKPRMFSKKSNLEMYFPLFNNLPAQGIRNDELFISGNATTDSSPFAYEDRYAEYKSRTNRVSGFMGLSHSDAAFDSTKIMARRFSSLPALNNKFVTMIPENIDMEVFSVVDEPPIDFSVGVSCRRVFPGPYTAIEGSLSSPALMR